MQNSSNNSPTPKWKSWAEIFNLLAETFNNLMPIIKIVASIMGAMMLVIFIHAQFKGNDDIDRYIAEATQFKIEAENAVAFAEGLKQEIELKELQAAQAIEQADIYKTQVTQLRSQTAVLREQVNAVVAAAPPLTDFSYDELIVYAEQVIPQQQEIIVQQEAIINVQVEQVVELERALVFKDETILMLTQSRDSLQFVLSNPPTVPSNPNKFLGINLPSRTTSFIAGVATGVAAIIVITK
jgi:hypothetical protein